VRVSDWSLRRARSLVGTKFLLVGGLVGFVVLAYLIEVIVGASGPIHLGPLVALVMAAVPAVLWLAFFYLWDRHEPEPKHFVAGVTVLGALIAAPLADFLIYRASPATPLAQAGLSPLAPDRVLYALAVVGLAQELCKYAVVRYTIYTSPEFDEPMDGVVYMMCAGTGFAVWVNYHRLSGLGHSVILSTGAAQAVITTLAHASFAGVLGYVLGRAKFSRRSAPVRGILLVLGLFAAAILNGVFSLTEAWISSSGFESSPWKGVGYAAGVAVLVFSALMLASRRLLRLSPHPASAAPAEGVRR
jgi:RsiW-degrading membrane proteinase PrsW (M82 family)